jgi:hypothetical protein
MFISCIVSAVISVLFVVIWHYATYKIYSSYITPLQKILTALPYLKAILAILMVFYIQQGSFDPKNKSMVSVYLDTIIATLNSIFKTILWFLIIIVATGWQLYKSVLNRDEMRKFIALYIFIYITVCFDQIIDLVSYGDIGLVTLII